MTVFLVGAGPGDPGLLTRRGAALLARAGVVIYDRLVDPSLLALAPEGALLLDAGALHRSRAPQQRLAVEREEQAVPRAAGPAARPGSLARMPSTHCCSSTGAPVRWWCA